ncbi:MAG: FmdB family transcriptional regulator [Actinobacteria bacterium]|nr:FmdB family transcriptional regulator [Actinomycetota bacterium]
MPTYEYKCRACGHRFEAVQPFSAEPLKECRECGGELGKVFGSIGITFKGSGFYRTDSRSGATAKSENGKDKAKTDTKSESSSESKSDSKAESKSESNSGSKSDSSKKPAPTGSGSKDSGSGK